VSPVGDHCRADFVALPEAVDGDNFVLENPPLLRQADYPVAWIDEFSIDRKM
jgi:hypothetical protein